MSDLTTKEAANVIGCSESHVRHLIRTGKLVAVHHPSPRGTYYLIPRKAALAARISVPQGGWPRGKPRSK
jgi:excisionase family DNA binding protein